MEDQVPGLPQIPALRRDRCPPAAVVPVHPVASAAQLPLRELNGLFRRILGRRPGGYGDLPVVGEAGEAGGGAGRLGPEGFVVVLCAGYHAADEGGEQQQVDRGEPGRLVHVEQPDRVREREHVRVIAFPLDDAVGVGGALWEQRPRYGGDRKEQQQHQGGTHTGQLPPRPPRPAHDTERRGGHVRGIVTIAVGVVARPERVDGLVRLVGLRAGGGH